MCAVLMPCQSSAMNCNQNTFISSKGFGYEHYYKLFGSKVIYYWFVTRLFVQTIFVDTYVSSIFLFIMMIWNFSYLPMYSKKLCRLDLTRFTKKKIKPIKLDKFYRMEKSKSTKKMFQKLSIKYSLKRQKNITKNQNNGQKNWQRNCLI